jgi:hypothetical protein
VLYTPLISFTPTLAPNPLERDDELRNVDEPIAVVADDYAPTWDIESRLYPDVAGFFLKEILGPPTTTAGNGVITDPDGQVIPTGCFRHVWTAPFGPSGFSPQTAQLQAAYKDESTFFKLKGAAAQTLSIDTPDAGGARLKSSGPALFMQRTADPALTPAYESLSVVPFERGDLQLVTWGVGGVTATTEDFGIVIDNPVEVVSSLGIQSKFPDVMEKGAGPILFHGSIPKREINATDYDALLNATGFAAKARWSSAVVIAAGYTYKQWVQFLNAQYVAGGPNALMNQRRIGASFDFKSTYNGTPGSSSVTLVNGTSSYA